MDKNSITISDIEHLAEMSALEFTQEEKEVMLGEVIGILDMFNGCADVDATIEDNKTITLDDLRDDEVRPSLGKDEVFMNTPRREHDYIVVPKVVD